MAFRGPDETLAEAVAAMFESARRSEKSPPRKHHLIPASYLARWSIQDRLRVTETTSKRTYLAAPEQAARETDFYSLASTDLNSHDVPPLLFETILSRVEGTAKNIIDQLLERGPSVLNVIDALAFAQFLALQYTRGRAFREQLMAIANAGMLKMWEEVTDEGIAARLREMGTEPTPEAVASIRGTLNQWKAGDLRIGPQHAAQVGYAAAAAEGIASTFLARPWRIYHSPMPMITCDEPVVPVGGPRADRREHTGLSMAGVVLFPLDPHYVLAMFHPYLALDEVALYQELDPIEADEINLELATHSNRWLFEQPPRSRTLTLIVPPYPSPRAVLETIDVVNRSDGEFLRGYHPTRWHMLTAPPPLPVKRWWKAARVPGLHDLAFDTREEPLVLYHVLP